MKYYLATTGLSEIWDFKSTLLLLGPWCMDSEENKAILKDRDYKLIPTPWIPKRKIEDASGYCYDLYEDLIPLLTERLNAIHEVSYPEKYWKILLGPWLLSFVEIYFDRYKRMEMALDLYPDLFTHALPQRLCNLASFNNRDFGEKLHDKETGDYYNLKIFSAIAHELCPDNTVEKDYYFKEKLFLRKNSWKRKLLDGLITRLKHFSHGSILLGDMQNLSLFNKFLLKCKCRSIFFEDFVDVRTSEETLSTKNPAGKERELIRLNIKTTDKFKKFLYKTLPDVIPFCYMENYGYYKNKVNNTLDINSIKAVGSVVGWHYNEGFKFCAAEAASKGAVTMEFQHGGDYGTSNVLQNEKIALEKNIFYSWGWNTSNIKKIVPLPSTLLSKVRDTYLPSVDNILLVGYVYPRYHYKFIYFQPEDMLGYFEMNKTFLLSLQDRVKRKLLYRPYRDYGWNERKFFKQVCPGIKFLEKDKGRLADWMKKAKLVVINLHATTFLEALSINVPSVIFWDHNVFLMKPEAEQHFESLRKAGILFKDPLSAAEKVNEIFDNPLEWWQSNKVQEARKEFCDQYGFASKDWISKWGKELNRVVSDQHHPEVGGR